MFSQSTARDVAEIVQRPSKGFVEVRGRLVHFIRKGRGPVVVLLHASPCSAKVMEPLQDEWSEDFTTFAFDLPGFGLSEAPDSPEVTIPLIAGIIVEAMDLLHIRDAALYGRHTGAAVALEIALLQPERISFLLTDGLPVFPVPYPDERLREYLPAITPVHDGLHLVWAFLRYREQHIFWPWDKPEIDHRADADMPGSDYLHRGAVELLEAAPTYATIYRAAFRHETLPRLRHLTVPACFGNRPGDSQFRTIANYPPDAPIKVFARDAGEAASEEVELLRRHPARSDAPAIIRRFASCAGADRMRDYLPTRHGDVQALGLGLQRGGMPLIFLHDLPGGFSLHRRQLDELAVNCPVYAFDFGGMSESLIDGTPSTELWLDQLNDIADALSIDACTLFAQGTSASIALLHAIQCPERVRQVILQSPPLLTLEERERLLPDCAPDISPVADGGHFLRLWHHLRDQQLWFPWFQKDHGARRSTPPRIAPSELTERAVTLAKQPRNYVAGWKAAMSEDPVRLLAACPVPVEIRHEISDTFAFTVQRRRRAA